jgi:hypothetical protein
LLCKDIKCISPLLNSESWLPFSRLKPNVKQERGVLGDKIVFKKTLTEQKRFKKPLKTKYYSLTRSTVCVYE